MVATLRKKTKKPKSKAMNYDLTIQRLRGRAQKARDEVGKDRKYLRWTAILTVFGLLIVVIGGELAVRRYFAQSATRAAEEQELIANNALNTAQAIQSKVKSQVADWEGKARTSRTALTIAKTALEGAKKNLAMSRPLVLDEKAKLEAISKAYKAGLRKIRRARKIRSKPEFDKTRLEIDQIKNELDNQEKIYSSARDRVAKGHAEVRNREKYLQAAAAEYKDTTARHDRAIIIAEAADTDYLSQKQRVADAATKAALAREQDSAAVSDLASTISRGGAVVGAIGIAILLMQIYLGNMRYYARLAENYEAQGVAFLASGGDPKLATEFLDKLSPLKIDFGKTPVTLYEKLLDTLAKAAGGRIRTR